jgi:PHP family Zn ribbon phosphoesterase
MLTEHFVDLHIHTVLSPCGELEMGAPEIIARARESGIDIIAITDHNECSNVRALQQASGHGGPMVLAGIEVQTSEDVHVVLIFPDVDEAEEYQGWLRKGFMDTPNRPEVFGYQLVIDQFNNIVEEVETLLVQGVRYSIDEVISRSRENGAIPILAHIDRPSFSFPAVLGPIPADYPVDAFELSTNIQACEAEKIRNLYPHRTIIRSSDSHELKKIQRKYCTRLLLERPGFDEIFMAIHGLDGRRVMWPW